jgi:hypothetical protein
LRGEESLCQVDMMSKGIDGDDDVGDDDDGDDDAC